MKLTELKKGDRGVITSVNINSSNLKRFIDFGLTSGQTIRFIKKSPFGDPLLYLVGNTRIAIRKQDALFIEVKYE